MLFLLLIGILHASLVWWGDILIIYAILGVFLLYFYSWQPKNILKIIAAMYITICLICLSQALWPWPELNLSLGTDNFLVYNIYNNGSFYDISLQRMRDWVRIFFLNATPLGVFVYFLNIFAIMLLGVWVQKQKVLSILEENTKLLILLIIIILILSIFSHKYPDLIWPLKGLSKGMLYVSLLLLILRNEIDEPFFLPFGL